MHDYLPEQMRCVITLDISMVTLRALSPFVGIFGYEKATEGLFFSFLILSDNWDMSICVFNIATLLQLTYLKQKMNKIHFNDNLNQDCGLILFYTKLKSCNWPRTTVPNVFEGIITKLASH